MKILIDFEIIYVSSYDENQNIIYYEIKRKRLREDVTKYYRMFVFNLSVTNISSILENYNETSINCQYNI